MKIYIASSWKNAIEVIALKNILVNVGHEVDAFCDFNDKDRFVFDFKNIPNRETYNEKSFLTVDEVQTAFKQDKCMIEWADCIILLLPAGKSSHLEAGYAKGIGKKLVIFGEFQKGNIDVMYGFANQLFDSLTDLIIWLEDNGD